MGDALGSCSHPRRVRPSFARAHAIFCGDREGQVSQAPLSSTVGSGTHILGEDAAQSLSSRHEQHLDQPSEKMMITRGRGLSGIAMAMNLMSMVAPSAPS